jgi:hypothetical protein
VCEVGVKWFGGVRVYVGGGVCRSVAVKVVFGVVVVEGGCTESDKVTYRSTPPGNAVIGGGPGLSQ